ncbi:2-dehydro-3-deoxygalactonokinase [Sphingobium sufflavum]|uniref:2-dehydro-3-deoxygalactonokinase n=1 Tax=Sphingobium sufflavum TaxID=1129547 RepID=UPI001F40C484|nr:2-dehydro-3-deoxygalactonokinase [Sphingobium sufflavum]MCE7796334.1 2-dehydro-3-deoxygalactonokinase [Sphingobium sufflavum]
MASRGMGWHVVGDWGTTRLRLFRVEQGVVVDRLDGPGIGQLEGGLPSAHLLRLLTRWTGHGRPDHVTLCGMAGARTGLREAPYVPCPTDRAGWATGMLRFDLVDLPVRIAAGVRHGDVDVMRGEETQIFGALAREPSLAQGSQLFILPGTHSKWARIENGVVTGFRTFFTGELFGLLRAHSTLARVSAGSGTTADAGDAAERAEGWDEGLARAREGTGLLGGMFESRAAQLLRGRSAVWGEGFLSGLLIGAEVAEGQRHTPLPETVVVIGAPELAEHYRRALDGHGVAVRREDGETCVLAGLELLNDLG